MLRVDVKGVHPSAYRAILKAQPHPGSQRQRVAAIASDSSATAGDFAKRYPNSTPVRRV
jgi:hypothetical protein